MAATTMPNTMGMTNPDRPVREVLEVTGGVDTHADTHTAAALDQVGGLLGTATFPATPVGYQDLVGWLAGFGPLGRVGVEGTGSYGAGLSRWLAAAEITVLEVNRPDRTVAGAVSPTPSTRSTQPGRRWPEPRPRSRKAATGSLRRFGCCT